MERSSSKDQYVLNLCKIWELFTEISLFYIIEGINICMVYIRMLSIFILFKS